MAPSFAIVTPSLDQGRFIERTVRSVIEQAYDGPLEYVVRDGGSKDNTLAALAPYRDSVRVICQADTGQAAAINAGVRGTSGELVGWLNSDDVYRPRALASVAEVFEHKPEIDVIYGDADLIDEADAVIGRYYTEPWNPARLPERCFLAQPAVFFRRSVVDRWGALDERLHYCLDYEYWLRLANAGAGFQYVSKVLAASRLHAEAKTVRARLDFHHEINTMLRARLGYVPESWIHSEAHTLTELGRARRSTVPVPYALEVVARSAWLSLRWNGRVSSRLLRIALGPILDGGMRRVRRSYTSVGRTL